LSNHVGLGTILNKNWEPPSGSMEGGVLLEEGETKKKRKGFRERRKKPFDKKRLRGTKRTSRELKESKKKERKSLTQDNRCARERRSSRGKGRRRLEHELRRRKRENSHNHSVGAPDGGAREGPKVFLFQESKGKKQDDCE